MAGKNEETTSEQFQKRLEMAIEVNQKMAALLAAGTAATSDEALKVMAMHHEWVVEYLAKDQKTYLLLADKYRTDDRFHGLYEGYAAGLAHYMGDAIEAYAKARLTDETDD
jgi:hypothetical protein